MRRLAFFLLLFLSILISSGFKETESDNPITICMVDVSQDSLPGKQALYNGRIWRNLYSYKYKGDQFLFSDKFLPGTITISGRSFDNIRLRYDIYNDEIMTITDNNSVLQLNKELVERFSIDFENSTHSFIRIKEDSISNNLKGYVDVLYNGKNGLYIKYRKVITTITEGALYNVFIQEQDVYVLKDGIVHIIKKKKDFIGLLADKKQQVRSYIKTNKIKVSRALPRNFVYVLRFYDSLSR
jgi:hypothetical protein